MLFSTSEVLGNSEDTKVAANECSVIQFPDESSASAFLPLLVVTYSFTIISKNSGIREPQNSTPTAAAVSDFLTYPSLAVAMHKLAFQLPEEALTWMVKGPLCPNRGGSKYREPMPKALQQTCQQQVKVEG